MVVKRRSHKAEIRRLADIARQAIERERAHRARLSKRGRRLARSSKAVGLMSLASLALLALLRNRDDRDDNEGDARRRPDAVARTHDQKRVHNDRRILDLAQLALTTTRIWEMAAERR